MDSPLDCCFCVWANLSPPHDFCKMTLWPWRLWMLEKPLSLNAFLSRPFCAPPPLLWRPGCAFQITILPMNRIWNQTLLHVHSVWFFWVPPKTRNDSAWCKCSPQTLDVIFGGIVIFLNIQWPKFVAIGHDAWPIFSSTITFRMCLGEPNLKTKLVHHWEMDDTVACSSNHASIFKVQLDQFSTEPRVRVFLEKPAVLIDWLLGINKWMWDSF